MNEEKKKRMRGDLHKGWEVNTPKPGQVNKS